MDSVTALAVAARDGDQQALEAFVRETQADVWRVCRYLGDSWNADDLAQETYARALRSLHRFRQDGSARAWLLTIARRTCADATRRAVRRRRLLERERADASDLISDGHWVEVESVLAGIAPERREAFLLTQLVGLPYDGAAEVAGCPVGTIRSRVARAREDLMGTIADGIAETG